MQRTGRFFFAFFFGRSDFDSWGLAAAIAAAACPVISLPFVSAGFLSAISSGASLCSTAFFFVTSQSTPKPGKKQKGEPPRAKAQTRNGGHSSGRNRSLKERSLRTEFVPSRYLCSCFRRSPFFLASTLKSRISIG